ncbi:hypothetical protein ACQY0O_002595 [Thecaphora frezii]
MASSSSSPITSVPDPSQSSALASVITQVQPGYVAGARPVRPKKVAKASPAGDAAKKKKKKKRPDADSDDNLSVEAGTSRRPADNAALSSQEAAVRAAAAAGSSDALRQAHGGNLAPNPDVASTQPAVEAPEGETSLKAEAAEHSHQPSTTLVDGSSAGNTLTNADSPPTATPALAIGVHVQDLDEAAEKLASDSSQSVSNKELLSDPSASRKPSTEASKPKPSTASAAKLAATASTSAHAPNGATAAGAGAVASEKPRPKKVGFAQRMIAIITCSSSAQAIAREDLDEKRGKHAAGPGRPNGKAGASTGVAVAPRTPTAKGGARLAADDGSSSIGPTTPGGGIKLPHEETGDVMSGAVVPPGASFVTADDTGVGLGLGGASTAAAHDRKARASGDASGSESEDGSYDEEDEDGLTVDDEYLDDDQTEDQKLIMQGGMGIPVDEFGNPQPLLGPIIKEDEGRKCLVLDLDETLVHSSFKVMPADFIVPVEIEGTVHNVYVIKRPGVDEFMRRMGEIYEVVVFTASLSKYADPVLDMLDIHHAVRHRLFRESCYNHKGNYVKDLSQLGRDIGDTIIIDNSPASYIFHPNNAVPISSWFNDPHDTELTDLCPFLADLCDVDDVRAVLDGGLA